MSIVSRNALFALSAVIFPAIVAWAQPPAKPAAQEAQPAKPGAAQTLDAPVDPNSYIIGPEDVISIQVWREDNLSRSVAVRPDGKITLPLIGDVQAGGLTPIQVAAKVTEAYSKYVNRPEVIVSVLQVQSRRYSVVGKVNHPGAFPLVTPTTVLEAIVASGGLAEFAKGSKITVLRGKERIKFNYKDVIKGKNLEQNILLKPGDYVIVP